MEAAKAALQQVLANIPDGTQIGLLVFSGANIHNEWVYPLGPKDTEKLIAAIHLPHPQWRYTPGEIYPNRGESSP